jgi:hypothetical protein
MAEKIVSPGVFTNEIDASFLPAAIGDIGAVVIGPTVKGQALVPTVVSSYSEYQAIFGDVFLSGSSYQQYLTSLTAEQYLKNTDKLTVVRILAGSYSGASANVLTGSGAYYTGSATAGDTEDTNNTSFILNTLADGAIMTNKDATSGDEGAAVAILTFHAGDVAEIGDTLTLISSDGTSVTYTWVAAVDEDASAAKVHASNTATTQVDSLNNAIVHSNNHGGKITCEQSGGGLVLTLTQVSTDNPGNTTITKTGATDGQITITSHFTGGITDPVGKNNLLLSGSSSNLRWEISDNNVDNGTFTLLIRQGNDTKNRKQILESWNNLSLDPNSNNYISKVVGDSYLSIQGSGTSEPYLKSNGVYPNNSKYIRVSGVKNTVDYLDENGEVRVPAASSSLPGLGSGSYGGSFSGGSDGTFVTPKHFYENITTIGNTQGLNLTAGESGETSYLDALKLLNNQDEYDFNLLMLPGVLDNTHNSVISKAIDVCEDRGDCFVLIDPVGHGSSISAVKTEANTRNSSYAAVYWPWVQIPDNQLGKNVWVPPSVAVAGMYAFNDKVSHEWFAPAGLNRGTLDKVIRAERKLTHGNRDDLYNSNVNPIATFPNQGVTVWGQKTLQKKSSALDRVNVRRLLIKLKKFIASSSRFLVFEQNNASTRRRFLNIVNPYMEQIQSNSGLNAFRVVMDETNNTPDVVDRNIMYGQIFVQPTKTAEFIVLDFTVQPTGATFPE